MPDSGRYSYSKVDCYNSCHFKFYLKYIENKYADLNVIAVKVGTAIHDTEELIANAIKNTLPINYVELKNKLLLKMVEFEHNFPKDYFEPDKAGRYYKDKLYGYLNEGIYRLEHFCKEHPELEIVGAEIPFKLEICGKPFTGKIDRLFRNRNTGKYICQDIKTYPVEVDQKDLATPLQFVIYTKAIKEMYGVTNEDVQCQYDLPFCNITQDAGTAGFMDRGAKKIEKLFAGINNQEFEPNPSPLCFWCEYGMLNPNITSGAKNLCPYHSTWTKEKASFGHAEEWQGLENHQIVLENYIKNNQKEAV